MFLTKTALLDFAINQVNGPQTNTYSLYVYTLFCMLKKNMNIYDLLRILSIKK